VPSRLPAAMSAERSRESQSAKSMAPFLAGRKAPWESSGNVVPIMMSPTRARRSGAEEKASWADGRSALQRALNAKESVSEGAGWARACREVSAWLFWVQEQAIMARRQDSSGVSFFMYLTEKWTLHGGRLRWLCGKLKRAGGF